jgi:hypothetical protein
MEHAVHKPDGMNYSHIETQVSVSEAALNVTITDRRTEAIGTVLALSSAQQTHFAEEAWRIGSRALTGAQRLAEESRLKDIGKTLLEDIDGQLKRHVEQQAERVHAELSQFLDPESGHLGERLSQLTCDGGTLPSLLTRHLGPENSVLVQTLVKHVGEQSPLFKKLSPTDSEGILHLMSERLEQALRAQNDSFRSALDPQQEGGAIAAFMRRLHEELKRTETDQAAQLKLALAALDTTDENSLLNQLRRDATLAREQLLQAINPAAEGSPLAIIHRSLTDRLERHASSQQAQQEDARKLSSEFQRDVRAAVERIEVRRKEELHTSRGGRAFEDAVLDFVQAAVGGTEYVVESTGSKVGARPACKTGDAVIHFPRDHAFYGARVVVEAKHDKSYTVSAALDELEQARTNRDACAGIFVMARSHACAGFPPFGRYGKDVLVVWDPEGPLSDAYLHAALSLGLALAVRHRSNAAEGDLSALQKIEQRIGKEVERLQTIQDAAGKIRKQVDVIEREAATGVEKLGKLVTDARQTLLALKVELREDDVERQAPIGLPAAANDADTGDEEPTSRGAASAE